MSDNSQLIGPFEERLGEELRTVLGALGWPEADVMVLESSSGNAAMIQVIYPFGYDTDLIPKGKPTISQAVEDFLRDKLSVSPWGFIIRKTHLRMWIKKESAVSNRLTDLSKAFAA